MIGNAISSPVLRNQKTLLSQVRKRPQSRQRTQWRGAKVEAMGEAHNIQRCFPKRRQPRPRRDRRSVRQNSAGFGCLPGKCIYKEKTNMFPQLHRTLLISSTLFYFQTEEHSETDCSLCRTREAAYAIQGSFCTLVLLTWSLMFIHLQRVLV